MFYKENDKFQMAIETKLNKLNRDFPVESLTCQGVGRYFDVGTLYLVDENENYKRVWCGMFGV